MNRRILVSLFIVLLCALILLSSGCLHTASIQDNPGNSSQAQVPVTPPPTVPMVIITPNASNVRETSGIHPPVHPPTIFIFSLPDAIDILGEPVYIPMKLPPGYAYGGGSANTEGMVVLAISNGSNAIQFLQVSPPRPIQGTLAGPSNPVDVNGTGGLCTVEADKHQFSWSDETHDYYLSGTLPCEVYIPMAASLDQLTTGALENVPWKEPQPATPLPQSEILNLVFSLEWLNAHDTNPDPQIFNVTMTSEEFNSSFSPDPEDQTLLRHAAVRDDLQVALLNMPKTMFAYFNHDPSIVRIEFPDTFFRFYDCIAALHDDLNSRREGSTSPGVNGEIGTPARTIPTVAPTTPRIS
jgi:hypothetical protein